MSANAAKELVREAMLEYTHQEVPHASAVLIDDYEMPRATHIYGEANAGRMGARLMAIVAEGDRGRVYLAPTPEMEAVTLTAQPTWKPDVAMPKNPRWFSPPLYGLLTYGDLFTRRQLVALTNFSDLVQEAQERVKRDVVIISRGSIARLQSKISLAMHDYRGVLNYLENFQQALTLNGYTVSVIKSPMDFSSKGSISADVSDNHEKPADFSLQLVWRHKQ